MAFDSHRSMQLLLPVDPRLESEYSLRARHPERSDIYERQARSSAELRARTPGLRTLQYAKPQECVLDFLPARATASLPAPVFVFIHGGYWRALERGIFTFLAQPWIDAGVHAAFVGYGLAPALRVQGIASQVQLAMNYLRAHREQLGIDTRRMLVAGHSAGAHLGACALDSNDGWHAHAYLGVSGIYDLEPLRHTSVNADIQLDAAEARHISPRWQPARRPTHHLLVAGGAETQGFRDQTLEFTGYLKEQGSHAEAMIVPGCTHFDILDALADPATPLFQATHALLHPH